MSVQKQKTERKHSLCDYDIQRAQEELFQILRTSNVFDIEGKHVYSLQCQQYGVPQLLHLTRVYPHLQRHPLIELLDGSSIRRPDMPYVTGISAYSLLKFIAMHLNVLYASSTSTLRRVWMEETCANIKQALCDHVEKNSMCTV